MSCLNWSRVTIHICHDPCACTVKGLSSHYWACVAEQTYHTFWIWSLDMQPKIKTQLSREHVPQFYWVCTLEQGHCNSWDNPLKHMQSRHAASAELSSSACLSTVKHTLGIPLLIQTHDLEQACFKYWTFALENTCFISWDCAFEDSPHHYLDCALERVWHK